MTNASPSDTAGPSYSQSYTYDSLDRLHTPNITLLDWTAGYDAGGNILTLSLQYGAPPLCGICRPAGAPPVQPQSATSLIRQTYFIGTQPVALRVVSSPPAATDGLYYLHTDHLGSVTLMTLPSGALHSEGTAQYQPFGGFQQPPAANPGLTRQGYTGHHHHNTGDGDIGLIYMNARTYLPNLARFASPDPLIPDPTNPQALNRYTYVLNSPLKFVDPSGHCARASDAPAFDENGSLIRFDCTLMEFDSMPIAERLEWMWRFAQQTQSGDWFNNIIGILASFEGHGLGQQGTWLSIVDAGILQGIQDGFASSHVGIQRGIVGNSASINWGKEEWSTFFNQFYEGGSPDSHLITLWGQAEQASTKFGEAIAWHLGLEPNWAETAFLSIGNWYRDAAGQRGGLGFYLADPFWEISPMLAVDVFVFGQWFNDPRALDPFFGAPPVFWVGSFLWWLTNTGQQKE